MLNKSHNSRLAGLTIAATLALIGLFLAVSNCAQQNEQSTAKNETPATTTSDPAATPEPAAAPAEQPTEAPVSVSTATETPVAPRTANRKTVAIPDELKFATSDLDGNQRTTQDWFTGGPVVLNFWGTWCPPCRHEIPALVRIEDEFTAKGVKLVSLSYNDGPVKVRQFAATNGMDWEQVLVDQQVLISLGIQGFPTTIFYTQEGKELGRLVGGRSYEDFHAAFSQLVL